VTVSGCNKLGTKCTREAKHAEKFYYTETHGKRQLETRSDDKNWAELAQDRVHWEAVTITVMKHVRFQFDDDSLLGYRAMQSC
jgi:hypothetical protein